MDDNYPFHLVMVSEGWQLRYSRKQFPFYFYVYFEGSPHAEESYGIMPGELPNLICSHVPMEIFLFYKTEKKQENQKRVSLYKGRSRYTYGRVGLYKGRFPYSWVLLRFENTLELTPSSAPPSREHTCMRTSSPTT